MRKILRAIFEKIPKNLIFDPFFLIWRNVAFFKDSVGVIFCPILSPNFMQKIRKNLRVHSQGKLLLTKGLTDNTEFLGPFLSWVMFKMTLN